MTAADPFDYDDDPQPAFDVTHHGTPILPPEPVWSPPPVDDDEAAFWREQRNAEPPQNLDAAPAFVGTRNAEFIAAERRVALTVPCPYCKVDIGTPCIIVGTNPPQPIRRFPAHTIRLTNARKANR